MARKNPFANLQAEGGADKDRPVLDYAMVGASRSILSSIGEMAARADSLAEGETIIDLDPDSVDVSFVQDRLAPNDQEFNELLEAIRERGQDSPILVRPHPSRTGRYMVVFGHRRLLAARLLGRKVRSVVKEMADRQHVIAQGQENAARANLSFIEKAVFAANVARMQYDDDYATILTALAIDRTTLSKMLAVAGLPMEIMNAVGPAKTIGRDRWYEMKLALENPSTFEVVRRIVKEDGFLSLSSDERFNSLEARLKGNKSPARPRGGSKNRSWAPKDGLISVETIVAGKRFTLAVKAKGSDARAFGDYLTENLTSLYEAFRRQAKSSSNGE